jgi:hypothetical protein
VLDLAGTDDERLAWQACEASSYLLRRGELHVGHALIRSLHSAWRDRLGPSAWPTLWSANYLAQALGALGRPGEAIVLEREQLDHFRATYGNDNLNTLAAANNVAARLAELGEHEQARALNEDTLTRRRHILGDDHPDTLRSAHNLANRLAALGEHEQARGLRKAIAARQAPPSLPNDGWPST